MSEERQPAIRLRGIVTRFGTNTIHDGLDMDVRAGEILGVVGGSGTGKSVLLKEIIGLIAPAAGTIEVLGHDTTRLSGKERVRLRQRQGVMFQDGALFSGLTVAENVMVPLREHTKLAMDDIRRLAEIKIDMAGLPPGACNKYPSELSGGMRKRAGIARALALDPDLLFLDEPTAGLDPIGAAEFDRLVVDLKHALGLTVFLVTHDLDTLATATDRIAALVDKHVVVAPMAEHLKSSHPWLRSYFHGPRARAAGFEATG